MTCTCPDFKKHRKKVSKNDPRRVCKHIYGVMEDNDILLSQTESIGSESLILFCSDGLGIG